MGRFNTTPQPIDETMRFEVDDLIVAGRHVQGVFDADVRHTPAERIMGSICYRDSPPDPAETSVRAIRVVEWTEYGEDGDELPKALTEQQVIVAAVASIEQQAEDRYL